VFVLRECALPIVSGEPSHSHRGAYPQRRVRLRRRLPALLYQRPEGRIIEVVDVRIGLSPCEVISDVLLGGVGHYSPVE
jgi:hypothetical protein